MEGYATTTSHRKSTHGPDDSINYSAPHNEYNIDDYSARGSSGAAEKAGLLLSLALLNELCVLIICFALDFSPLLLAVYREISVDFCFLFWELDD